MTTPNYPAEYDAILGTLHLYVEGSRQGKSEVMRSAFHPGASFFGYVGDHLAEGTEVLFDWIDGNGPAPDLDSRVLSVDILDSVAIARLEVQGWSGKLAGTNGRTTDVFTLLRTPQGWTIIQKAFHWHAC